MRTTFYNQPETLESANLIKQQIMTLGSALFITENESLLKLPVHVINNVQMDEQNRIWFLIQRPTQALTEFDQELPAKLDFFKKGVPYFIKIAGTATIVDNAAKVNALTGNEGDNLNLVAICVKIRTIDHFETGAKPTQNWLQQSKQQLSSLFS
jgi:general stress protein 26